jgi:hypothetical protein
MKDLLCILLNTAIKGFVGSAREKRELFDEYNFKYFKYMLIKFHNACQKLSQCAFKTGHLAAVALINGLPK